MADERVYGIDLGTTYSCIAYVDEHGKPVVVPNSHNQRTTPSVVWFEDSENIVVGQAAKDGAELYPDRVIATVKRVMGDEHTLYEIDGTTYTPQDVSSLILQRLVKDAEMISGDEIKKVVITCPAYFDSKKRAATKQAGVLADLEVLYVIPEPTAAALAYGMEQEEDQVVLVYDLGGGTFDITMIEVSKGSVRVICVGGDPELGGRSWDETIASYFAEGFSEQTGVPADDLLDDPETYQELLSAAEKCKLALSSANKHTERIRYGMDMAVVDLTREKFDEITADLLNTTLTLTETLLDEARGSGHETVDKILLVGGSTFMPQVQGALEERFSTEIRLFDPNEAVAKGAAMFGMKCEAEALVAEAWKDRYGDDPMPEPGSADDPAQEKKRQEIIDEVAIRRGTSSRKLGHILDTSVENIASRSFGVVVFEPRPDGTNEEVVVNLITRGTSLPAENTQTFPTAEEGQMGVTLRCVENTEKTGPEHSITFDPAKLVGDAQLDFGKPQPVGSLVEVTFKLTEDGLLDMHGRDLTTGNEIDARIEVKGSQSDEEVARSKSRNLQFNVN